MIGHHTDDSKAAATVAPPSGDEHIRCSLIVLNYNRREILLDCVRTIRLAAGPADEIIVVDNGSTDGSADAVTATFPDVTVIRLLQNRYIFGLNDGLAAARGKYVAFCNNDMTVETNFVSKAIECFVADDIFAVCSRVLDKSGNDQGTRTAGYWKRGLLFYDPLPHRESSTDCFFAVGGQSFFRRDLLLRLGSIDELLWPMYHEDIELSYRAWKSGFRIVYAPDSVCHHQGGATSRAVFSAVQLRSFVRQNELLTVWKNVTDPRMLVGHVLCIVPRLVAALLRRDMGTLVGSWHAVRRLRSALRARPGARRQFVRTDRQVLELVSASSIDSATTARNQRGSADAQAAGRSPIRRVLD